MRYLLLCFLLQLLPAASRAHAASESFYFDRTCIDISATFGKFQKCNAGALDPEACTGDFAWPSFAFDNATIEQLRGYHFILLPGGDYDFFSSLVIQCQGGMPADLKAFHRKFPGLASGIMQFVQENVCPDYLQGVETYYDILMGAFAEYEKFFGEHGIAYTRLRFSKQEYARFIGDRAAKVDILGAAIEMADHSRAREAGGPKKYILIGHSFGGLNIIDFMMELLGAHVSGTPEWRLFRDTTVRGWPEAKKKQVFGSIRGLVLINTFVQGLLSPAEDLVRIAQQQGLQINDAEGYFIDQVLRGCTTNSFSGDNGTLDLMYHAVLSSNRYRRQFYLKDLNSPEPKQGAPVRDALTKIASEKAVIAAGCSVPPLFPYLLVQANFLVYLSKTRWQHGGIMNDGMVDTYSTILPRDTVEFILLRGLDHGALVLKPAVQGISVASSYDQLPFIKTLLKRLMTKIPETPYPAPGAGDLPDSRQMPASKMP